MQTSLQKCPNCRLCKARLVRDEQGRPDGSRSEIPSRIGSGALQGTEEQSNCCKTNG